jgi:hypothetical protein
MNFLQDVPHDVPEPLENPCPLSRTSISTISLFSARPNHSLKRYYQTAISTYQIISMAVVAAFGSEQETLSGPYTICAVTFSAGVPSIEIPVQENERSFL